MIARTLMSAEVRRSFRTIRRSKFEGAPTVYPVQHQYLTVIGDCYGATERWQFGLRLSDGGVDNLATAQAIQDDVSRWWNGTAPYSQVPESRYMPTLTHRLTEIKVARILPNGTYPLDQASASVFYVPPIVGPGAVVNGQSAQQTMAVTLLTAVPRGLGSKGRVFLPPSSFMIPQPDGRLTQAVADQFALSISTLIGEINANAQVGNVQVISRGKGVKRDDVPGKRWVYDYPTPGTANNVTGVRCGRVIDTQRRRRRSLPESPGALKVVP